MSDQFIAHPSRRMVVAGALAVLGPALAGCGFSVRKSSGPPDFTPEELVDNAELSTLDELGIARAKASRSLRLDFRAGSIAKSDVGLPDTAYGPDVIANEGEKLRLTIAGSSGTLEADTNHVRFVTTDSSPVLDVVHYFLTAETLDEYVALLRDAVHSYGLDADPVERWITSTQEEPGKKSSYAVGVGKALGFNVEYDLRYDGSKTTQVIIVGVSKLT
ncbi:hypothetical protein [Arthrobacter glacialis]|uniref:hypothetical protein n=1 Tax=Arthrobacter glacialis TaxID=1664 RepID=UPI000CD46CF6|nr:hypothetical protein [Arthrobacter glacialis]POH61209.1 hypothetical protein CVS28_01560 [Arthrobacter glacialis]